MSRDRLSELRTMGRPEGSAAPSYSSRPQYGQQQRDSGRESYASRGGAGRSDSYEMRMPTGRNNPSRSAGGGDFYSEVEEIQASIDAVNRNISGIERLHSRALVGVSQEETSRINRDLDALQNETNDLIDDARRRLQRLSNETKTMRGPEVNSRQAQQSVLAKKLMDIANAYQKVQVTYKQKYRQRMEREVRIARPDASRDEVERMLDTRSGPVFAQEMLSGRIGEQRRALQEVQGRHEELLKMEQSIEELAQLFQDMQLLLETQQEMIDTIDTHVENAHNDIEGAGKELTQAINHRIASRKKYWWLVLLVIILLGILAFIIWLFLVKPEMEKNKK